MRRAVMRHEPLFEVEQRLRNDIAQQLQTAMQQKGVSVRGLARLLNTSTSQVGRLLNRDSRGGTVQLDTVIKAFDALGFELHIGAYQPQAKESNDALRLKGSDSRHSSVDAASSIEEG